MDIITVLTVLGLCIFAYLCGSIPYGYLVAKLKGINIQEEGSGSTGMTNVWRIVGKKWGTLVFILDYLKATVPTLIAKYFFGQDWVISIVILITVLGHIYPVWLKFKAGKGVASTLGGITLIIPGDFLLIGAGVWLVAFLSKRFMSLANLVFLLFLPVLLFLKFQSVFYYSLGISLFCIIAWAHRKNIIDIIDKKERQFDLGLKHKAPGK